MCLRLLGGLVVVGVLTAAVFAGSTAELRVTDYVPPGGKPPGGITGTTGIVQV